MHIMPPEWWNHIPERRHLRSQANSTIKNWRERLHTRDWIILEGLHLIEMYTNRYGIPPILILPSDRVPQSEVCRWLEHTRSIENIWRVDNAPLKLITSLNTPPPLLALAPYPEQTTALSTLNQHSSLWLDEVQDPGNVGTLLRTALGAGVTYIVCGHGCADIWSPKVLRAAQGAHFHLTLWQGCNLIEIAQTLPSLPKWAAAPGGIPYYKCTWPNPIALILGNEGQGISPALAPYINQTIGIPLNPVLESLNVAIAGALLLFESQKPTR